MTYSVYQHWDPLKACVVGRSYPPEFYSWITVPHVRSLFEKIAIETEEDYQNIIKKLHEFGVEVLRPDLSTETFINGRHVPPPMTPRDYTVMIGDKFYEQYSTNFNLTSYNAIKDPSWPKCNNWTEFNQLPNRIIHECKNIFNFGNVQIIKSEYDKIFDHIRAQGNTVDSISHTANGAMCARIGKDLYFGTESYNQDTAKLQKQIDVEFLNNRNHIVDT